MQLKECRKRLLMASQRSGKSFTTEEQDFALQTMLREMDMDVYYSYEDTTALTMTANNPELSLASLNTTNPYTFRPEKVRRAELAYTDNGAWSGSSVSYTKGIDLVTNDNKFYVCTETHTSTSSNGPDSGSGLWTRRLSKRGDRLTVVDYDTMARHLGDSPVYPRGSDYVRPDSVPAVSPNQPYRIAFQREEVAYVWPVPDVAYKITFTIEKDVADWTAGTEATLDIAVPHKYLVPAIVSGGVYYLDAERKDRGFLEQKFQQIIKKIKADANPNRGVRYKNTYAYLDQSDGYFITRRRTRWT